jgi:hypothetical protein
LSKKYKTKTKKGISGIPAQLYQHDKNYIRPLDQHIEEIFDPEKNKFFKNGECERFLFKKNKKPLAKLLFLSTIVMSKTAYRRNWFFDCINDQETANFIFDHCKKWLQKKGMEAWTGLLISGKGINSGGF